MTKNTIKILSAIAFIATLTATGTYVYFGLQHKGNAATHKTKKAEKPASKTTKPSLAANDDWAGEPFSYFRDLQKVEAKNHLISSAHALASKAGEEILAKGGSAVDAAIAAQMVLNVVEPQSSGIGGGAFLLHYDAKSKKTQYFNGRETAPAKAHSKMFLDKNGNARKFDDVVRGGLSVGTPGILKALKEAHDKYGQLEWSELFAPAINLAQNGFEMDERIAALVKKMPILKKDADFARIYLKEDGSIKDLGSKITNPELAKTFATIAQDGIKPFYEGEIAKNIAKKVQNSAQNPGFLSVEDLKNYQIKEGNLICGTYRKHKICSMPLPSSGGVAVLQILGILENFDLAKMQPFSASALHLIVEATRLGYADRNKYVADVADVPIDEMLNKEYLKKRSLLIKSNEAIKDVEAGKFANLQQSYAVDKNAVELPSTTHLSVIDGRGNAVSMTSSIEYYFGSLVNVDGFLLNNQLTDFSFTPEIEGIPVANRVEPGKQPRSSMSPTFVFDENDNLVMVVGSPGGPRIIQFVTKAIIAHLDWGFDVQKAISAPNFVVLNDIVELEKRTDLEKFKSTLENLGHEVKMADLTSGIHAISISKDNLTGGADPRRAGGAAGK
jgi:gamma-glutamyltranspeptidase / glutathione hydrolase